MHAARFETPNVWGLAGGIPFVQAAGPAVLEDRGEAGLIRDRDALRHGSLRARARIGSAPGMLRHYYGLRHRTESGSSLPVKMWIALIRSSAADGWRAS